MLEWVTLAWMAVEAVLAIASGILAHSVSVSAFGLDSVIELLSGGVLMWRLQAERTAGGAFSPSVEHRAHRTASVLLLLLAAFVVVAAVASLWTREGQHFTWGGVGVTIAAVAIMIPLARAKRSLAERLDSRALRADAAESAACAFMAVAVLVGLALQYAIGAWWIDGVVSLGLVFYLVREGLEAWGAEEDCC